MQVLINELSIIEQFDNRYSAEAKMDILKEIILNIFKDFYQDDTQKEKYILPLINHIKIHSNFSNCKLCSNFTIANWLQEQLKYNQSRQFALTLRSIQRNRDSYIDNILNQNLQYWECTFKNQDYCESSLAGAAFLEGILISLQDVPEFQSEYIEVNFRVDEQPLEKKNIYNLTNVEKAKKLRPRCNFTSKHNPNALWENSSDKASPMNLIFEEAQKVLDYAVIHNLTDGKQYYGYHEGKFYEFQPGGEGDGSGKYDTEGYPLYHGYEISEIEFRQKASNILRKLKQLQKIETETIN